MCFDEFGTLFSIRNKVNDQPKNIDRDFLQWMCDRMTTCFYSHFFIDKLPENSKIEMSYQYCLNLEEENENTENDVLEIAINIGNKMYDSSSDVMSSLTILPSLFNLVRILQYRRCKGDLTNINALPGIGILLPKLMENESKIFDFIENEDVENVTKIIDIHFHLANWLREIISGFSSQAEEMIKRKILTRLTQLVEIENRIRALLRVAPKNYKPPNCLFALNEMTDSKFKKPNPPPPAPSQKSQPRGRKKKAPQASSTVTQANQTVAEGMTIIASTMRTQNVSIMNAIEKFGKSGQKFHISYGLNEVYRPMDLDIMFLLNETLELKAPLPKEMIGQNIGLLEFKFIIYDLITKFESLSKVKSEYLAHFQYSFCPADLMNDLILFIPKILDFIQQFIDYIKAVNDSEPNDLFKDESNYIKISYGLCLRLLSAIYDWPDFRKHDNILRTSLRFIARHSTSGSAREMSIQDLALQALKNVTEYENSLQDMQSAVYLYQLALGISEFVESDEANEIMVTLCSNFLSKRWFAFEGGEERGLYCNILLDKLLKGYFKDAKLPMIRSTIKWVSAEINNLKKKNGCLTKFPLIHKYA